MRPFVAVVATAVIASAPTPSPRTRPCAEPHYRWSEKIDLTLATQSPSGDVDVADVLSGWASRTITAKDKCAARLGRETRVYRLTGWVRRLKRHELDGDWHIELTENEDDRPIGAACVIVEIPNPTYGPLYGEARAQLAGLVDTLGLRSTGDLTSAVLVTFTGAAFFDGYHQKVTSTGVRRASGHGRCNSSVRALWELHPVYKVEAPEGP